MYTKEDRTALALNDLEHEFTRMLERVQSETQGLIPEGIDVGEAFGIARSGRSRGATMNAQNQGPPEHIIELNQMWRKTHLKSGRSYVLSQMLAYYTEIAQALKSLPKFSAVQ